MPESVLEGNFQLTTPQANKSRCITMVRWVVEVVNGRFKRDFKIFRQDFFNLAAQHLMDDFKIASALLNKFHPLIEDNPDASILLELALNRLEKSRHISGKIYFTYILVSNNLNVANSCSTIQAYYCNCLVGMRTVGCCAHVMSILWYLGFARHQENINLTPALFLDNILIDNDYDEL